jgi:isopentenyl-diphosphate delta-isomerase
LDIATALVLGASLGSLSQPVLQAADKSAKDTESVLSFLMEELRNVMFLVGAENVAQLAKAPVVVTGKTAEWLKTRGFNVDNYARRGVC